MVTFTNNEKIKIKSTNPNKSILLSFISLLFLKNKENYLKFLQSPHPESPASLFLFKATNCSNLTVFFIIKSPQYFFLCKLTYKTYYTKWNFILDKILSTVIFFSPSALFKKKPGKFPALLLY